MAIVEMSKLRLVGLKSEKNAVMSVLSRCRLFEPSPTKPIDGTQVLRDEAQLEKTLSKQARLSFAIEFLTKANQTALFAVKKAKKKKKSVDFNYEPKKDKGRPIISYADLYNSVEKENELLDICDKLDKISFEQAEIRSRVNKIDAKIKTLAPYGALPLPFSTAKTNKKTSVIIALATNVNAKVDKVESEYDVVLRLYPCNKGTSMALVCLNEDVANVKSTLNETGWSVCTFIDDKTASEMIGELEKEKAELLEREKQLFRDALSYEKYLTEIKTFYDYLSTEIEKAQAESEFAKTDSAYVLEGWLPKQDAETITAKIKEKTQNVVIYLSDPTEDDTPPTLLDNPKLVKPFEGITNMYSSPSYREKDPNFVMSIFFFIIFGMMMADAGYGLVLSIACTLIVKFTKMEQGTKSLAAIFGICGISTIAWGALFGSWFGFELLPFKWFNPLQGNGPIMLLIVCIVLGVLHLMVGYGFLAMHLIRKGKWLDAIFDVGLLYLMFIGIALLALPMVIDMPSIIGDIGLYTLLGSIVLIFFTAGRHRKGIAGKLAGGVSGVYGLVNLFSDVLSYARIFGIALAGGAIASAFNSILGVITGIPIAGIPIAIVLGVALHMFNLLISLLGAYVHNARLQFLEFYGKFYVGEGRLFSPLGVKTKYTRFN